MVLHQLSIFQDNLEHTTQDGELLGSRTQLTVLNITNCILWKRTQGIELYLIPLVGDTTL